MTNLEVNAQLSVEINALREMLERVNLNAEPVESHSEELDLSAEDMSELEGEDTLLANIAVYQQLTEFEAVAKAKKDSIKKELIEYMQERGIVKTPSYQNLFATIETRTSYSLDPILLQLLVSDKVFADIVVKSIDLNKVRQAFLDGLIPVSVLRLAEVHSEKEAFAVRKDTRDYKENKKLPFWAEVVQTENE